MTNSSPPSFSETFGKALAKAMAKLAREKRKAVARPVAPPAPAEPPLNLNTAASARENVWRYECVLNIEEKPRVCAFWATTWKCADGQNWTRKFSVNFWGEDVAEQKARRVFARRQRSMRKRGR